MLNSTRILIGSYLYDLLEGRRINDVIMIGNFFLPLLGIYSKHISFLIDCSIIKQIDSMITEGIKM